MLLAAWIEYDHLDRIPAARPHPRAYIADLQSVGKIALAGPLQNSSGALMIYDADDHAEVEQLIVADPYFQAGVFKTWQIREFTSIFATPSLLAPHA